VRIFHFLLTKQSGSKIKMYSLLTSAVAVLAAVMTWSAAQSPSTYSPQDEANYIALDAMENDLLPNAALVSKIEKTIVQIRKEFPEVSKVRNTGNWYLGRVLITNYSPELKEKIEKSEYGPLKEATVSKVKGNEAELTFSKPYEPNRLSNGLKSLGATAQSIWYESGTVKDLGHIRYNPDKSEYTFREGLDNCGPDCTENRFWTYKVDETSNNITLAGMSATSVPKPRFSN